MENDESHPLALFLRSLLPSFNMEVMETHTHSTERHYSGHQCHNPNVSHVAQKLFLIIFECFLNGQNSRNHDQNCFKFLRSTIQHHTVRTTVVIQLILLMLSRSGFYVDTFYAHIFIPQYFSLISHTPIFHSNT